MSLKVESPLLWLVLTALAVLNRRKLTSNYTICPQDLFIVGKVNYSYDYLRINKTKIGSSVGCISFTRDRMQRLPVGPWSHINIGHVWGVVKHGRFSLIRGSQRGRYYCTQHTMLTHHTTAMNISNISHEQTWQHWQKSVEPRKHWKLLVRLTSCKTTVQIQ